MILGMFLGHNRISVDSVFGGTLMYLIGIGTTLLSLGIKRRYKWSLVAIKALAVFGFLITIGEIIFYLAFINIENVVVLWVVGIISAIIPTSLLIYYFSSRIKMNFLRTFHLDFSDSSQ